ncbi:hypothetical protein DERP_003321 [Dermatophagoides pteronyssinus]|uniref:Uncharacterized protein n=1 Tax=Dermatophagoides pteronyssinus TaxID=6956 RepID=A0ABQ8JJ60_DERPT|nr:hypothetical protein DERP_003321 [Dermatophagoides pteronyssinus]
MQKLLWKRSPLQPVSGKKCLIKCNSEKDVEKICNILKMTTKSPQKNQQRKIREYGSWNFEGYREKEQIPTLIKAKIPRSMNS